MTKRKDSGMWLDERLIAESLGLVVDEAHTNPALRLPRAVGKTSWVPFSGYFFFFKDIRRFSWGMEIELAYPVREGYYQSARPYEGQFNKITAHAFAGLGGKQEVTGWLQKPGEFIVDCYDVITLLQIKRAPDAA